MQAANARLRGAGFPVAIYQDKGRLLLQGTFPPKPGSDRESAFQQKISLKLAANHRCIAVAEREARKVGVALESDSFDWQPYMRRKPLGTVDSWVQRLEIEYIAEGGSYATWEGDYLQAYKKLPGSRQLSVRLLTDVAKTVEPNSRQRQRVCMAFARLARFAELDAKRIVALRGRYSADAVDPRSLPSDALISQWRSQISSEEWRWCFGMLACYGLRPHELFRCDLEDFPTARVDDKTKTGDRFVWPVYPEWAEAWELWDIKLPKLNNLTELPNTKLGSKVSRRFYKWAIKKPDGNTLCAYDLRHCFARRCFEFEFSPDFSAKMMGHSLDVHMRIYRRWIDEGVYRRIYDAVVSSPVRPHPPP